MGGCCANSRFPRLSLHPFQIRDDTEYDAIRSSIVGKSSLPINYADVDSTIHNHTSMNKSTNLSPRMIKKPLSVSKLFLCDFVPRDEQKRESSIEVHAGYFPAIGKKREGTVKISLESNSPAENWAEESTSFEKMSTELNPGNQQSHIDLSVTNLPLEIVDQLGKLMNTDSSVGKLVVEKLVEWITELPTSEKNIVGESETDPYAWHRSNGCRFSTENEEIVIGSSISSRSSDDVSGESDTLASLKNDEFDEKIKVPHIGIVELSRQKEKRRRSLSTQYSEPRRKMSPLINDSSSTGWWASFDEDQKELTEIDIIDNKISQSTQKLSKLRKMSLNLLTDVDYSTDREQSRKCISYISIEKDINRWQNRKKKLIEEREQIITRFNSKLIQQISSSTLESLKKDESPQEGQTIGVDLGMQSDVMKSDSIAESFSALGNICHPKVNSEAEASV